MSTTKTFKQQLRTFKQQRSYARRHDHSWHLTLAEYLAVFNSGTGECDCGKPATCLRKRDYSAPFVKNNMVLTCGSCSRIKGRQGSRVRVCQHCGDACCQICPKLLATFNDDPNALYFFARLAGYPRSRLTGEPGDQGCKSCLRITCEQCVPLAKELFHGDTASLRLHLRSIHRQQKPKPASPPLPREPLKLTWTDYSKLFAEL